MALLSKPDLSKHKENGYCDLSVVSDDKGCLYIIDDLGRVLNGVQSLNVGMGVSKPVSAEIEVLLEEIGVSEEKNETKITVTNVFDAGAVLDAMVDEALAEEL